jgi:hypothetical protein
MTVAPAFQSSYTTTKKPAKKSKELKNAKSKRRKTTAKRKD